jgi:hypothetical protein
MTASLQERREVTMAHLINRHLESLDPNAMHGPLLVATLLAPHQEIAGRNRHV